MAQDRPCRLERGIRGTDDDEQVTVACTDGPTADGGVHELVSGVAKVLGQRPGRCGADRAGQDDGGPGRQGFQGSVGAEQGGMGLSVVADGQQDDVSVGGGLSGSGGDLNAGQSRGTPLCGSWFNPGDREGGSEPHRHG